MSINAISNNSRNLESMIYKRKLMMIPKDKLPQRHFDENYNSDGKYNIVAMNRDANKAEIQEMAKLLSQSKTAEAKEDKKIKVVSTAGKAEDTKEDDEHNTSDKSTLKDVGSTLTKEGLYRYTGSKLLKPNPYLVAMSLLGVDFEEDGNALKKGAETGKIGDFGGDYKNYFNGMWDRASESEWKAAWEGFNLPANVISIGLQDSLQTVGVGLSKVIGKKPTEFLGSGVATAGTTLNAIGDVAGDTIKGSVGIVKNLFTGDFDGIGDSAKDIYNGVKDSVVNVANSVADFGKDGADVVVDAAEDVYDVAKDGAGYVADGAEEVYDVAKDGVGYVADAVEEVGDGIADVAEDAWDEVEDFFGSIF